MNFPLEENGVLVPIDSILSLRDEGSYIIFLLWPVGIDGGVSMVDLRLLDFFFSHIFSDDECEEAN